MCNTYFYLRISTKESQDKQSYNRQYKSLKTYAESNNIKFVDRYIYKDDITGTTFKRTEWEELESNFKKGDTVVFKEISRFTREANEGYKKYMELMIDKEVNLIFIDNPTVSTDYIKNLTRVANEQNLVAKTALEGTIKLLLIVELDRVQQEREIIVKRIKQGIEASEKKSGRVTGKLDKMSDELRADIKAYNSRSIKGIDLMNKYNISRNTLKKYAEIVKNEDK